MKVIDLNEAKKSLNKKALTAHEKEVDIVDKEYEICNKLEKLIKLCHLGRLKDIDIIFSLQNDDDIVYTGAIDDIDELDKTDLINKVNKLSSFAKFND